MGQLRESATPCNISILIIARLTYKYHRLVASSDRPGELPQVEKCVVDDDEEDEEEVREVFLFSILWPPNSADHWKILDNFELPRRGDFRKSSKAFFYSSVIFARLQKKFGEIQKYSDGFRRDSSWRYTILLLVAGANFIQDFVPRGAELIQSSSST